jgi:16S rRNA (adenine1518-N6/adenine1519-N6)-dimethyltransferase
VTSGDEDGADRAGAAARAPGAPVTLLTPRRIRDLLAAQGLRPQRGLGQHFLADGNTARRIVRLAGVAPGDRVLEIGPGIGSLTLALAEAGAHVVAVERDRGVLPVLADVLGAAGVGEQVTVVREDARHADWAALLGPDRVALVANLPYNVATPLVVRILETAPQIDPMLVMVQREVGERLAAPPGAPAAGAVSVKVAYYGRAEVAGLVPPSVFVPRPKVDSALVRLVRHAEPPVAVADPERLFAVVRAGFAHRRKTLRRALAGVIDPECFAVAGVDPGARAETLGLEQWARLSA